jgi:hypothetical protein
MNTSKLFHAVVVLGMAMAAESITACSSSSDTPTGGTSGTTPPGTPPANPPGTPPGTPPPGPIADAGGDSGGDAFAGWFCCG